MRRLLLSNGLAVFAGIVSLPVSTGSPQLPASPASEYRNDPRVDTLRNFFERGDCPAAELTEEFLSVADEHALDWRLLPSISLIESSGGKAARGNNLFGWDSGRAEFPSMRAGIHLVAERLANSDLYRDKDLDELLAIYNPNAEYAEKVKTMMRRIAPSE